MNNNTVVNIVDDDASVRHSLGMLMQSVGLNAKSYASAREFLDEFDASNPGCLVIDVRMADMGGLELQAELMQRGVRTPVIIITGHGDIQMAVRAMKAGAADFIEKPFHDQRLLDSITAAIVRSIDIHQAQTQQALFFERLSHLTPREQEVMQLLINGKSCKLIAHELGISSKTVDVHRGHLLKKMEVKSVVDLTHLAMIGKYTTATG
ncbi:MAG: response regulator [Pseudomonadota bacterium]|nr:response regulator [Pseudomonadota bacterium]